MKIHCEVNWKIGREQYEKLKFEIEIPDEIIENYAINVLDLMTEDMASEMLDSNPPENDSEPD
jgi:hypothetical protein